MKTVCLIFIDIFSVRILKKLPDSKIMQESMSFQSGSLIKMSDALLLFYKIRGLK